MRLPSDDAEIVYEVEGGGPPVILLHPFPTNREFWRQVAEMLAARYRLILPDLRGHGDSHPGEGPALMEKHAADLARLCQAADVRHAVFIGVSIGGYILFEFWRTYRERVAGLVLCDTRATADTPEARAARLKSAEDVMKEGAAPFVENMLPKLLGESTRRNRPDLVARGRAMMMRMTPAGINAVQRGMAARPDSVPTLKTIDVPTLILVGEEDTLTSSAEAELMRREIPRSQLDVVPYAGHFAPFEQPEAVGRMVRSFLDAQSWS